MTKKPIEVETLTHAAAKRRNIPTAELQALVEAQDAAPKQVRYPRETPLPQGERRARNPDLDPQLVWRGKDECQCRLKSPQKCRLKIPHFVA